MTERADPIEQERVALGGGRRRRLHALGSAAVALATGIALLGLAIPLFLNPAWVSFEQDRARADAFTGYTTAEVHRVTGSLLHDLVVGPPAFEVVDDRGRPVLGERERSHLRDVRAVFGAALAVIAVAVVILVVAGVAARRRPWLWRGVRAGARGLAVAVVALGVVSVVAFDAAFEVFHELFFAGGTFTFDPRTDRLVQLFPDQFWSETTLALGVVLLLLAWDVNRLAGKRLGAMPDAGAGRNDAREAPTRHGDPAGATAR